MYWLNHMYSFPIGLIFHYMLDHRTEKLVKSPVTDPGGRGGDYSPSPPLSTPILHFFPSLFLPATLICWTPSPHGNTGYATGVPPLVLSNVYVCLPVYVKEYTF